ncbi:MAG: SurA N-terminal domain-containing protein [Nitrospirota bacterium]
MKTIKKLPEVRIRTAKAVLGFLLILLFADNSGALTVDRVLASVNNEIITLSDYKRFVHKIDSVNETDPVDERILKSLIEEKIMLQEAGKKGIDASDDEIQKSITDFQKSNNLTSEEFERSLTEEGLSLNDYKKLLKENIISLKLIDMEVISKVIVTDEEILNYYNKNKNLFLEHPEKHQIKAIFLKMSSNPSITEVTDLKIKSLKIYRELKDGESFDKMMSLYSEGFLNKHDEMLGEFQQGELIPVLDRRISEMKEGQISEPLWTRDGVYILKLIKKIKEKYTSVNMVKDGIYEILFEQKREEKFNEWMKSLWAKSSITIKY